MSTRLDLVLQKLPEHEEGIRLLASRDPSGNLKYLDWGAKVLESGQALAPEVADIIELFHRFRGLVRPDLYTYQPKDLSFLRSRLFKHRRAVDRKRRERERLYRIEGAVEADTVYDSADLIVRHIKNKQASVHYGLGTKWCISMLREGYFEDYETHNATFFFFERKAPVGDDFDKVALVMPRNHADPCRHEAFTAGDRRIDMINLAGVHGPRVFDIFRDVYERSARHPPSTMSQVYAGTATAEQLAAAFAAIAQGHVNPEELGTALQAICCNDAAPQSLLAELLRRATVLSLAAWSRRQRRHPRGLRRRRRRPVKRHRDRYAIKAAARLKLTVMAAVAIHANVSADLREKVTKSLRRNHVRIDSIRRTNEYGRLGVCYETSSGSKILHGHRRQRAVWRPRPLLSVKALRARAERCLRTAAWMRKRATALERKQRAAKAKKRKAPKRRRARA